MLWIRISFKLSGFSFHLNADPNSVFTSMWTRIQEAKLIRILVRLYRHKKLHEKYILSRLYIMKYTYVGGKVRLEFRVICYFSGKFSCSWIRSEFSLQIRTQDPDPGSFGIPIPHHSGSRSRIPIRNTGLKLQTIFRSSLSKSTLHNFSFLSSF
jgi:hypothetical protein